MTGKFLSLVGGLLISVIVCSQIISTSLAKEDSPSANAVDVDSHARGSNSSKVIHKRSKSTSDEFGGNTDLRLSKKKQKLLRNYQDLWNRTSDVGRRDGSRDLEELTKTFDRKKRKMGTKDGYPGPDIIFLGCIDPWDKQYTNFHRPDPPHNENYIPATCAEQCSRLTAQGQQMRLSFLKGAECRCAPFFGRPNSTWIDTSYCDVPCPVKDFKPDKVVVGDTCGGNRGYSVYCKQVLGQGDCNELDDPVGTSGPTESHWGAVDTALPPDMTIDEQCAVCDSSESPEKEMCRKPYHFPNFDYFPANSPEACVEFCATTVRYVANTPTPGQERLPTAYAVLTWILEHGSVLDLPICQCLKKEDRHLLTPTDPANCNMYCPGKLDSMCGGLEQNRIMYSTIYCIDTGDGNCPLAGGNSTTTESHSTTEELPTSTEPTTEAGTTESLPPKTTDDPCAHDEIDCDPIDPPSSTTEETGTSTTKEVTTTKTPTTTTTTTTPKPVTTTSPTTTTSTPTTTTTSTTSTTTERPTTTTLDCPVKCKETDSFGTAWEACANSVSETPCSNLIPGAIGRATWRCLANGRFATPQPNTENCQTPWVGDWLEKVGNITEIEDASAYMTNLENACRSAYLPDSEYKYFGQDITSIASMVDQILHKIQDFDERSKFSQFELIIQNAVNINAYLVQYRDPWEFLPNGEKSSTCTYLFQTTESALFNLTDEFSGQNHAQIFSLENATEENLFNFLIFAETFNKRRGGVEIENYEFPPNEYRGSQDSFIKLPSDWKKLVKSDDVEIAAMSMDAEYVTYIMPGQYDELSSSANIAGEGNLESKLVNGKLISLSVASPLELRTPRMSFTGKGAEITFYHDIEAWGDEQQDVHRKLHYMEKPRAVLGTSQCVFWNTEKLTWSTTGCRVVSSNRHRTICECSHLTAFAVLMDVHRYVGKQLGLEIVTLILCPLSEIALILSIVILSSVNNLQRIRTTITKNLAGCLFVGNAMVLLVLDRNYFNMSEGLCVGSAMLTHYVFLSAFMWMLIEGVQLYRMVIHVFDSGNSYIKHFAVLAYGAPLLVVTITATTGYLQGDKPYGGDVYCWLDGSYIWSFMAPVAIITMINLVILFIALKTAYQLQQSKTTMSPTFFNGKLRSYRTWFKGCFSLTCILGLTWVVGFFMLMKSPTGLVAAYLFTILNSSQGIFIFLFNCVFNEKVRSFTQRNLSTYLPSWLSSSGSGSSNPGGNDASIYGKRPMSPQKSTDASSSAVSDRRNRLSRELSSPVAPRRYLTIPKAKLSLGNGDSPPTTVNHRGSLKVGFDDERTVYSDGNNRTERTASVGTVSSVDSIPNSYASDNGHNSSDTSQNALISALRSKPSKNN